MSHDFAKHKKKSGKRSGPQARKLQPAGGPPGWLFFVLGVAATVFVQFAYHSLRDNPQLAGTLEQAKQNITAEQPPAAPARPDITFYNTLPQMQVDVAVESVAERGQETYSRALQAGSFKSRDDANQQRAEIMLLGLEATIESHTNSNGTVWYRVIVGPFSSRSDLNKARNILVSNNMPTLVINRN
ncbi:MAG TPA: SPOR domain-containing protein [Pseudomonadales bacterium]